ncbi:DUF2513 domain-containing protein [Peribacillus simplex]|uniref:DUF2513 domain-containing protein n=1 Tax=Peribacillus simplex TaxID=1478 RepID=UPI001627FED1|nr:DUF2513 domain-containing protein [Peribacillus simplex]
MKLNHDCVRDLLLAIEESDSNEHLFLQQLRVMPLLTTYDEADILYSAKKLKEKNYIKAELLFGDGRVFDIGISEMTWDGHEFLDNIRDNQIWKQTKNAANKVTGASLSILSELAKSFLSQKLGLS